MDKQNFRPSRLLVIGLSVALSGLIFYVLLLAGFASGKYVVLASFEVLSVTATIGGLITAIIAVVMWSWKVPLACLLLVTVPLAIGTFLWLEFAEPNVHGPGAIFILVMFIVGAGAALLFLVAAIRFATSFRRVSR